MRDSSVAFCEVLPKNTKEESWWHVPTHANKRERERERERET
jgi:hypothetical protein